MLSAVLMLTPENISNRTPTMMRGALRSTTVEWISLSLIAPADWEMTSCWMLR